MTIIAGYWVTRAGRPINPLRFNLHKFLALGAVILAGLRLYPRLQEGTTGTVMLWLTILLAILVVALFASGAFQSRPGPGNPRLKALHAVAAYAALAVAGAMVYLLIG